MPQKRTPIRTCVGCGAERAKRELVRIVRTPEGTVVADATGKRSGRGAYLDPSPDCLDKGLAGGKLDHALDLQTPIAEEDRARLEEDVRRLAEERKKVLEIRR
ncbi:MAG: hypothetical protein AUH85_17850 [Chloroflexi bacterium 13_1_40CM_4_68_4]|nr:MAG: hypothetical protein AUH85_17850 [Chloroflexi bacterium 13_1_40CM_4_68_4]